MPRAPRGLSPIDDRGLPGARAWGGQAMLDRDAGILSPISDVLATPASGQTLTLIDKSLISLNFIGAVRRLR